jgi:hypothetical protein
LAHSELQAVFDLPEEFVAAGEFLKVVTADVVFIVQLLQSKESAPRPQPDFPAAMDALQALHKELNIANPPSIELYVERGDSSRTGTPFGHQAFTRLQDGLNRSEA